MSINLIQTKIDCISPMFLIFWGLWAKMIYNKFNFFRVCGFSATRICRNERPTGSRNESPANIRIFRHYRSKNGKNENLQKCVVSEDPELMEKAPPVKVILLTDIEGVWIWRID